MESGGTLCKNPLLLGETRAEEETTHSGPFLIFVHLASDFYPKEGSHPVAITPLEPAGDRTCRHGLLLYLHPPSTWCEACGLKVILDSSARKGFVKPLACFPTHACTLQNKRFLKTTRAESPPASPWRWETLSHLFPRRCHLLDLNCVFQHNLSPSPLLLPLVEQTRARHCFLHG